MAFFLTTQTLSLFTCSHSQTVADVQSRLMSHIRANVRHRYIRNNPHVNSEVETVLFSILGLTHFMNSLINFQPGLNVLKFSVPENY